MQWPLISEVFFLDQKKTHVGHRLPSVGDLFDMWIERPLLVAYGTVLW